MAKIFPVQPTVGVATPQLANGHTGAMSGFTQMLAQQRAENQALEKSHAAFMAGIGKETNMLINAQSAKNPLGLAAVNPYTENVMTRMNEKRQKIYESVAANLHQIKDEADRYHWENKIRDEFQQDPDLKKTHEFIAAYKNWNSLVAENPEQFDIVEVNKLRDMISNSTEYIDPKVFQDPNLLKFDFQEFEKTIKEALALEDVTRQEIRDVPVAGGFSVPKLAEVKYGQQYSDEVIEQLITEQVKSNPHALSKLEAQGITVEEYAKSKVPEMRSSATDLIPGAVNAEGERLTNLFVTDINVKTTGKGSSNGDKTSPTGHIMVASTRGTPIKTYSTDYYSSDYDQVLDKVEGIKGQIESFNSEFNDLLVDGRFTIDARYRNEDQGVYENIMNIIEQYDPSVNEKARENGYSVQDGLTEALNSIKFLDEQGNIDQIAHHNFRKDLLSRYNKFEDYKKNEEFTRDVAFEAGKRLWNNDISKSIGGGLKLFKSEESLKEHGIYRLDDGSWDVDPEKLEQLKKANHPVYRVINRFMDKQEEYREQIGREIFTKNLVNETSSTVYNIPWQETGEDFADFRMMHSRFQSDFINGATIVGLDPKSTLHGTEINVDEIVKGLEDSDYKSLATDPVWLTDGATFNKDGDLIVTGYIGIPLDSEASLKQATDFIDGGFLGIGSKWGEWEKRQINGKDYLVPSTMIGMHKAEGFGDAIDEALLDYYNKLDPRGQQYLKNQYGNTSYSFPKILDTRSRFTETTDGRGNLVMEDVLGNVYSRSDITVEEAYDLTKQVWQKKKQYKDLTPQDFQGVNIQNPEKFENLSPRATAVLAELNNYVIDNYGDNIVLPNTPRVNQNPNSFEISISDENGVGADLWKLLSSPNSNDAQYFIREIFGTGVNIQIVAPTAENPDKIVVKLT